jgi:hypothetical protein
MSFQAITCMAGEVNRVEDGAMTLQYLLDTLLRERQSRVRDRQSLPGDAGFNVPMANSRTPADARQQDTRQQREDRQSGSWPV